MGFFYTGNRAEKTAVGKYSLELLHKAECGVCPLNHSPGVKHPNMKATGSSQPLVYMLGEAPGADEDAVGRQFVGKSGRVLRFRLSDDWEPHLRWNNCVRTRPPENRTPTTVELECCRPSIIRDIEKTKPVAVFGFGNVPLQWATGQSGISRWNGRRVPIKVGSHTCWFFPMYHPSYIMRSRKFTPRKRTEWGSDLEFVFAKDLERALDSIEDLPQPIVHTVEQALSNINYVTGTNGDKDVDAIIRQLDAFMKEPYLGYDLETPMLRPYEKDSRILTVAFAGKDVAFSWPLYHREAVWTNKQIDRIERAFEDFLYDYKGRKIAHSLMFEMEWTAYFYGTDVLWGTEWDDTESQAYILDHRQHCLSLDFLCLQYFGLHLKDISNVDRKNLDRTPLETVLRYNALDAKYHRALSRAQLERLDEQELMEVYEHQLRRVPTMTLTQLKGIPIDQEVNSKFYDQYTAELDQIEDEIDASDAGKKFRQLTGRYYQPSANRDVLFMMNKVVGGHIESAEEMEVKKVKNPIAELHLRWKHTSKLLSTYIKPVRTGSKHLYNDGMIHPVIHLTRTSTWRTSGADPNPQNWPKRKNREVRSQVRPGSKYKVVAFDYGQIQARNVAMESKDKALIKAFWERYDIHTDWMERILKYTPNWDVGAKRLATDKDARKKARDRAKNGFVFPSFFGAQPPKLSNVLELPLEVTTKLSRDFWQMFPNVKGWHESVKQQYETDGYVTGLTGFRRYAPVSPNEMINAPIQADEVLIVCDAMARLSQIGDERLQATLEIHDDLTFIWHKNWIDELAPIVIEHMLFTPFKWAHIVPIVVEMSVGDDWASTKEPAGGGVFASDTWKKT